MMPLGHRAATTFKPTALMAALALCAGFLSAQGPGTLQLKIERVMTPREMNEAGISTLSGQQRQALDAWLNRYTQSVLRAALAANNPPEATVTSKCSPAIETTISGDFQGWEGETVFKLDNGQIWEQAEFAYTYSYSYRPEVTIYHTNSGCRLKVEGENETILVKGIK
jgi:hypothetical protein